MRQLAEAARKIEARQYGASVPMTRQDELGDLAATFNRMTSAVAEREERLRESAERFRAMTESAVDAVITAGAIAHEGALDEWEAFIAKPLDPEALLRKVRVVLDATV